MFEWLKNKAMSAAAALIPQSAKDGFIKGVTGGTVAPASKPKKSKAKKTVVEKEVEEVIIDMTANSDSDSESEEEVESEDEEMGFFEKVGKAARDAAMKEGFTSFTKHIKSRFIGFFNNILGSDIFTKNSAKPEDKQSGILNFVFGLLKSIAIVLNLLVDGFAAAAGYGAGLLTDVSFATKNLATGLGRIFSPQYAKSMANWFEKEVIIPSKPKAEKKEGEEVNAESDEENDEVEDIFHLDTDYVATAKKSKKRK